MAAQPARESSLLLNQAAGTVNLAVGHPSESLLPHAVLASAADAAAAKLRLGQQAFNLGYGRIAGELPVLEALAAFLTQSGGEAVRADRLFLTNGVSHSLELVCAALLRPGDTVLVVRPTYFLASGVFVDHGARLLEVPADETGLDLRALEELLLSGVRPRLLYVVPTHANPTGCTLPAASRAALVRLAERYAFYILADEVYQQLSWGTPVPARLRAFDAGGDGDAAFDGEDRPLAAPGSVAQPQPTPGSLVISVSSFTKTLAPGLRLGWVEASAAVLARLASRSYLVSGGGVAPFASLVVLEALLSGGQDAHLARLTAAYARRCAVLCDALSAAAGDAGWSFVQPQGGYFVWLRLPADVAADALLAAAKARGVAVLPGARCCGVAEQAAHTGGVADAPQHVRLCFAFLEDDALREGVRRLATALADARCCEPPRPAV